MNPNESHEAENGSSDGPTAASVNRRSVLKASMATGAAGMFAGCSGALPAVGDRAPADRGAETDHVECPTVVGFEDGFLWVHKTPPGPWGGELIDSDRDAQYATGQDIAAGISGRANIGMARVEIHEPGAFEFRYRVEPGDLTWVEEPRSLVSILFPDEPWQRNDLVTSEDVVAYSLYPYESDTPLSMSFSVDEPGTYNIAYGPADGLFVFEEWLPDITTRDEHLNLGLAIEGDEEAYSWVFPELPVHVWVWSGQEETILNRSPHAPEDIDCQLDPEMQR